MDKGIPASFPRFTVGLEKEEKEVHSSLPEEERKGRNVPILASQKERKREKCAHSSLPEKENKGEMCPF